MKPPRLCRLAGAVAGILLVGCVVWAQVPRPQARPTAVRPGADGALEGVFLPPDRQAKRRLETSVELIEEKRYGEAVRLLGSLLEDTEDFFFKPDAAQPVFRSLKAEAGRLLGSLPSEGRESYELQFGAQARALLQRAAAANDLVQVAEVSRRFFYTQAGAEATYLLGRQYLDQSRPLAAAMCFERLRSTRNGAARLEPALSIALATCWLRCGKPEKARMVLAELRRTSDGAVSVRGQAVPLFAGEDQALAWMEQHFGKPAVAGTVEAESWGMFRGDERRNAASSGGRPLLSVRWRQRTADDRAIEEFVDRLRHDYQSQDAVALSSMHPLAVGDVVLMRTAFALQAVDFETGKLVWRYATADESLEQFLRAMGSQQSGQATQQLLRGLDQRMWEDATYGTLSSDSERVYYIEDLSLGGMTSNVVMTVLPNGQKRYSVNTRGTNRLAARELRTQGKLKWEVGGVTGGDEPKLAGAFFLGPPLPLLGSLYALVEMKGQEVRLVVLSAENGALEWSQQLAVVDAPVTQDTHRRNAGATPSFADGVLVCPTAAGAIVGIDLSTRSLVWGYQYPRGPQFGAQFGGQRINARAAIYAGSEPRSGDRWADATVTVAEGRVLATPVETEELYCLHLLTGETAWKADRGTSLYVACVHEGKIILVGRDSVKALHLSDGREAWPSLALEAGTPSGRGFYSPPYYYLPLSSAEVVQVDVANGKIVERSRSRSGTVPGNLVCYRDSVLSQGADYLDAYFQLDELKKRVTESLAKNADDPAALTALGEVKLDEGALAEAVALFRRSYALAPSELTRVQLVDSLLSGLRADFATYQDSVAELEELIDEPHRRLEFLRLKAIGLQRTGNVLAAFDTYLQLVDEQADWELESIDEKLSVRRDRWIRQQLAVLRSAADAAAEQKIDAVAAERFERALAARSAQALREYLNVFGALPQASAAREALAARLTRENLLELNVLLERRMASSDAAIAGPAVARTAAALAAADRLQPAAVYYRQLAGRFADVVCADGQTGRALVEGLPPDHAVRALLAEGQAWPEGEVIVREEKSPVRRTQPVRSRPATSLEVFGGGPLFADLSVSLSYDSQRVLSAENGLGANRFRIELMEQGMGRAPSNRSAYNMPSINYAGAYGGLMVLSLGTQLVAVDTLRGDTSAGSVLWSEDLNDQLGGLSTMQSIVSRPVNVKWGPARYVAEDSFGRRYGRIGPVTPDGVCFQRQHALYCVDPLSGKVIWTRNDVELGVDLFGDAEYLFAAPPEDGKTLVLSAASGELLDTRSLPPIEDRMATIGRQVLSWREDNGRYTMEMRDAWQDQVLWSFSFAPGSKAAVVGQDVVGVFQPDGEFSLVRLADGKLLAKESLRREQTLLGIYLIPSAGSYLLVVHTAARNLSNVAVQPFPNVPDCPLVSGQVYAFDAATGAKLWPAGVPVVQHGLWLNQPRGLPVLVLVRQMHKAGPVSARESKLSVMCIDKRSGRLVYHKDDLPGTTVPTCELRGDPLAHTVTVGLASQQIILTYTNQPVDRQAANAPVR